jgi:hypothetical protein
MPADPVKPVHPRQPLLGGRDIFVLLLIGTRNHESGQLPPRQFGAKGGKPRRQRHAAFGLFECLEMSFEHRLITLEPFPFRWNRNGALAFCFDAFSSREPVPTSLENALEGGG